jgi:PAS domain S-box-containing protein
MPDLARVALGAEGDAGGSSASSRRILEATLLSIPDYVYAFDREHRFAYANPAMLRLFGLSADEMLGRTFADLRYPADLADKLNRHIDEVLSQGITIEDEFFYRSPTGHAAYFSFVWGPVHDRDGCVELVVGVSRETTERRVREEKLRTSEARLRAATSVARLGIYSWDPVTGALDWDERLHAMWGVPADAHIDMDVFQSGIHQDDLPRFQQAIAKCVDPTGDGRYEIEYRVVGRDDGVTRHIATLGQTKFANGRAVSFIGAAIDVTAQRRSESAIRTSEALFRSFAEHSNNLIWIGDLESGTIIFRSAAYEKIWGVPRSGAPTKLADWMHNVHPEDRQQVEHSLSTVRAGEVAQFEYRIVRPTDGTIRWLRETSFPILDENGAVARIGGITEDLTLEDVRQVYIVTTNAAEGRRLARVARALGYRVRIFDSAFAFLALAPVLAPGCVLVDIRTAREEGLSVPRELKARSVTLPSVALDTPGADVADAVRAMKAGVTDYMTIADDETFRSQLANVTRECHALLTSTRGRDETQGARVAKLTLREREVLFGLVDGGTNKSIARQLGISPRTVEVHRAQVMNRLNASSLTKLLQIALLAGVTPSARDGSKQSGAIDASSESWLT